ncbi:MAG: hypothetical protein AB1801_03995 [Chloroflexota bacterium]
MNSSRFYRKKIYLILFFAVIALAHTLPIFHQIENWGIQDWDQHLFFHGVPRVTVLEYRQFPLWNPYYVGGAVMLANPQSRFLSPTFLFHLLLGEVIGIKIEIWLHLVMGLLGMYALARYYQLDRAGALLASSVFMLNSMYALTLTVGMTWFLTVAYVPWVFLYSLKGLTDLKYGLVSGLFLVLIFFGGGVYPLSITVLFLGIYVFILFIFREYSLWRLTKLLAVILVFMLCLGAIKFFPTFEFQHTHPRLVYDYSGYSLNSLRFSLFSRDQTLAAIAKLPIEQAGFFNGVTGGMDENGMYIGLIPFVLFLSGIGLYDKRRMFLFLSFLIFLWISLGNRPRAELWSLLHLLPVYNSMRLAQRFRIVLMLCLAILAGFGFQTLRRYTFRLVPNKSLTRFLTSAVLGVVLIDLLVVSSPVFRNAFSVPPVAITKSEEFHQVWGFPSYDHTGWIIGPADTIFEKDSRLIGPVSQVAGPLYGEQAEPTVAYTSSSLLYASYGSLYPTFLANIGTINGYESANVPKQAVPVSAQGYKGEVYLKDTTGEVAISDWSPNRVTIKANVSSPGFAVLNQNYYAGWHSKGAGEREVEEVDWRLAVRVLPGDQAIELYYQPISFIIGGFVTLATILFSLIFVARLLVLRRPVRLTTDLVPSLSLAGSPPPKNHSKLDKGQYL